MKTDLNNYFISYSNESDPNKTPIAVKDNICVKGFNTTCGSKTLQDYKPNYNATVVDKLLSHNHHIVGKTNMDEFAMGSTGLNSAYGIVKNPLNSDYISGGSSSGSAAAVASGIVDIALGSDTGGSVRLPAAFCGVFGFKPTYGSVSRYGLVSFASSLDVIGVISNNLKKMENTFKIIYGKDNKDSSSIRIKNDNTSKKKLRIATLDITHTNCSEEIEKSYYEVVNRLKQKFDIDLINLKYFSYWISTYLIISSCEAVSNLSRYDNKLFGNKDYKIKNYQNDLKEYRTKNLGDEVKRRILTGNFALLNKNYNKYFKKSAQIRRLIKSELDNILENYDLIITPTSPTHPFRINQDNIIKNYNLDTFTSGISLAGLPAISIPVKNKINEFYPGIQIIGAFGDDFRLLEYAKIIDDLL